MFHTLRNEMLRQADKHWQDRSSLKSAALQPVMLNGLGLGIRPTFFCLGLEAHGHDLGLGT